MKREEMPERERVALTMLEEVVVVATEAEEGKRTVVCCPDLESRVKTMTLGTGWKVEVNPYCPEGSIFVIDTNALEADLRAQAQRTARTSLFDHYAVPSPEVLLRLREAIKAIAEEKPRPPFMKITGLEG